jgi:hypothetical protein
MGIETMESTSDNQYYQALIPLKNVSIVPIIPERLTPFMDTLGMLQVFSVDLITGRNGSTQPSHYLRITFLDRYERLSVRLTRDPKLLREVFDLMK